VEQTLRAGCAVTGAKAQILLDHLRPELKSCPDTKHEFFRACEAGLGFLRSQKIDGFPHIPDFL
jgi:hypothetical protein